MNAGFFDDRLTVAIGPDKLQLSKINAFFSEEKHAGWERRVIFDCDRVQIFEKNYENVRIALVPKHHGIDVQKYGESIWSMGFDKKEARAFDFDSEHRIIKLNKALTLYFDASLRGLHDYNLAVITARYLYLIYDQIEKKHEGISFDRALKKSDLHPDEAFHSELSTYMLTHKDESKSFEVRIPTVELLEYDLYDDITKGIVTIHLEIGTKKYYSSKIHERHEIITNREYIDKGSLHEQKQFSIDAEIEAVPYLENYTKSNEIPRTIQFSYASAFLYRGEQDNSIILNSILDGHYFLFQFKSERDYNCFIEAIFTVQENFSAALSEYEPYFRFIEHAKKSKLLAPMDKWVQRREAEKARAVAVESQITEQCFRRATVCETTDFAVTAVDHDYGYVYIDYELLCVSYHESSDCLLGRDINYVPISYNNEYGCIIGSCKEVVERVQGTFPKVTYDDIQEGKAYKCVVISVSKEHADCACGDVRLWFSCSSMEEARKIAPGDIVGCYLWRVYDQENGSKSYHWTHIDVPKETLYLENAPQPKKSSKAQSYSNVANPVSNPIGELNELIGLRSIKQDVTELIGLLKAMKIREERGLPVIPVSLHLVFTGNPGTGKTTVARILAQLYKEIGVLEKGQLVEVDRSDLVAGYVGQTAIKTQEKIEEAKGGIIFIDEAYTLAKEGNDFGQEAIDTILKEMEDHRGEFVVIVAGYSEPMRKFIGSNPGLKSRFNKYFEFSDYNQAELIQIFDTMCAKYACTLTVEAKNLVVERIKEMEENKGENFANARDVRNLFEKIITKQANRVAMMVNASNEELTMIERVDVE